MKSKTSTEDIPSLFKVDRKPSTRPSSLASSKSRSSTIFSSNTTTSRNWTVRTPLGLGSLTGRALTLFGETALRGIANFNIRRRLAAIASVFPHDDDTAPAGIDEMYDDLLDLSRPDFYGENVRGSALRLLFSQIARGQTACMTRRVTEMEELDIRILMSELSSAVCQKWHPDPNGLYSDLWSHYRTTLDNDYSQTHHAVLPFIEFVDRLATSTADAASALVDSGTLDILLHISFCDDFTFEASGKHPVDNDLREACTFALCSLHSHRDDVLNHAVAILWPTAHPLPLTSMKSSVDTDRVRDRTKILRVLSEDMLGRRLFSIGLRVRSQAHLNDEMYDDLLELFRPLYSDTVRRDALRWLIIQGIYGHMEHIIRLAANIQFDLRMFMSRLISLVYSKWSSRHSNSEHFHRDLWSLYEISSKEPDARGPHGILDLNGFVDRLSQASPAAASAIVDGGILDILLRLNFGDHSAGRTRSVTLDTDIRGACVSLLCALAFHLDSKHATECLFVDPGSNLIPAESRVPSFKDAMMEVASSLRDVSESILLKRVSDIGETLQARPDKTKAMYDDLIERARSDYKAHNETTPGRVSQLLVSLVTHIKPTESLPEPVPIKLVSEDVDRASGGASRGSSVADTDASGDTVHLDRSDTLQSALLSSTTVSLLRTASSQTLS
ncbi:hypothetical protein PLICRDRAFT_45091 [Plicaturopsis crispa FD-325 SS-3]|nr:hypothetical protein PLICRDRAFT_45091 [Plicaturopsis crispa FD-325 SS-3]